MVLTVQHLEDGDKGHTSDHLWAGLPLGVVVGVPSL